MACSFCAAVRQYAYNMLLLQDLALNTTLGGDPHESVSQRTGRARAAGSKAAAVFCVVLTFIANKILRRGVEDHCTWAMAEQTADADEIWHWTGSTSSTAAGPAVPPSA